MFQFVGTLSASKSLMNRALIAQSFAPALEIHGASNSRDVTLMREALTRLREGERQFECGDAGTVLRFLALRVSRIEGEHLLTGSERLFSRPQKELEKILRQLGCECEWSATSLRLRSYGWRLHGDGLFVSANESSQFASAVALSSWDLPFALPLSINGKMVSQGYWQMTLNLCRKLGLQFDVSDRELLVHPQQEVIARSYDVEIDLSSAFAVAALAAVSGSARILNFPSASIQPDAVFVKYMEQMQFPLELKDGQLIVRKADRWAGLRADLNSTPDLLPVLAILCAFAETPSELTGVEHVAYKESNRLAKTKDLLTQLGARAEVFEGGRATLKITPVRRESDVNAFSFDPDRDHRMAMAAAVAQKMGRAIKILTPEVVNKSFPDFWQIAGVP